MSDDRRYGENPALGLRRRYMLALSLIALLTVVSQVIIQATVVKNDDDGRVINIAGRQRMLSQKIAKLALALPEARGAGERAALASELKDAAALWRSSNGGLLGGSAELGLKGNNSPEVLALFGKVVPLLAGMATAAEALADRASEKGTGAPSREELARLGAPIAANEAEFLAGMNEITFQYDEEARGRAAFISLVEYLLLGLTFATLALEAVFIFRPAERKINDFYLEIKRSVGLLEEQASYDAMTGLFNKRTGLAVLAKEIERARRSESPLCVCFLDMDGLKEVNDRYGHEEGDRLITRFARVIKECVRAGDSAFRFGGDEFVLVLACPEPKAREAVNRLRRSAEAGSTRARPPERIAFSCGIAALDHSAPLALETFLALADERMYADKKRRKDAPAGRA
jgi:diguanylate cyclase (GGDEF)-like protein